MEARRVEDRLPWLDTPPAAPPSPPRSARPAFLFLLALFVFAATGLMAFLLGRETAPVVKLKPTPATVATGPREVAPTPALAPTTLPPALAVAAPAQPPVSTPAAPPRAAPSVSPTATPPAPAASGPMVASAPPAEAPAETAWTARPFAGPRGRVIELGAHATPAQADAAWWQVARAYPYLATLPRMVAVVGGSPGQPQTYRIRIAAPSTREASALCRYLHSLRRGCIIA